MAKKNEVRVFGMHKAGTSCLMKALSHFCHRNNVTLASTPFGMMPLEAYDNGVGGMDRKALMKFLSYDPDLLKRVQAFSKPDYKKLDVIDDRLTKAQIISIGDVTNEKRVSFYRNSSVPVWEMDVKSPALRIIRNPLSIVKSAYFSHLKTHSIIGWTRLAKQREALESLSKPKGLWKTYEFMREDLFYHCTEGPLKTLASWPADLESLQTFRMEDMTTAPSSFLLLLWRMLGGDMDGLKFVPPEILTFEHQSGGRKPGEVDGNNHMRSGDPEEWRKLLPKDLIKQIRKDYGPLLEEYYPTSLHDKPSKSNFLLPPKHVLKELEGVYTEQMESRKRIATAEATNTNLEGRLKTILEQRDKSAETIHKRFEDMKNQRNKAAADLKLAKALKTPKAGVDSAKVTKLTRDLELARKALANMEQQRGAMLAR